MVITSGNTDLKKDWSQKEFIFESGLHRTDIGAMIIGKRKVLLLISKIKDKLLSKFRRPYSEGE